MKRHPFHSLIFTLCLTTTIVLSLIDNGLTQRQSRWFPGGKLPNVGAPRTTRGSSVRGSCAAGIRPIGFVPASGIGQTMHDSFPLYFYIPQSVEDPVSFKLVNTATQAVVYEVALEMTDTPTLLRVSMGTNEDIIQLESGQLYQWSLAVDCDPSSEAPVPTISGTIQRQPFDPDLEKTIESLPLSDRPLALMDEGLDYDAIVSLLALMEQEPNNPTIETTWETLLPQIPLEQVRF